MRRLLAIILLAAIGLSVPAVADRGMICLAALLKVAVVESDCCHDCHDVPEQRDPCCLELKKLPDAQTPLPAPGLPGIAVTDLPQQSLPDVRGLMSHVSRVDLRDWVPPADSALRRRAVLANWRL